MRAAAQATEVTVTVAVVCCCYTRAPPRGRKRTLHSGTPGSSAFANPWGGTNIGSRTASVGPDDCTVHMQCTCWVTKHTDEQGVVRNSRGVLQLRESSDQLAWGAWAQRLRLVKGCTSMGLCAS